MDSNYQRGCTQVLKLQSVACFNPKAISRVVAFEVLTVVEFLGIRANMFCDFIDPLKQTSMYERDLEGERILFLKLILN